MTNAYYNHTDASPYAASAGLSRNVHAEFQKVATGLDLMETAILATTVTSTTVITAKTGTILVDTSGGNVVVTLPASGLVYTVKRITAGANTLTIQAASGNIDNAASMTLSSQYESVTLNSDGTDYWII